ncbi:MAG: type VI secretion system protein TssA [Alphaproteobacteria bacterium]
MRSSIDYELLIAPLNENEGVGVELHYESEYDNIKEARREDDPTLSQGVWVTDLKKADWQLVEKLCMDALTEKTKDLQIVGWLCEAWVSLDEFDGLQRGITLLCEMIEKFGNNIYPQLQVGKEEERFYFFEWFDKAIAYRSLFLPVTPINNISQKALTITDWRGANHLNQVLHRSSNQKKALEEVTKSGAITLPYFRKELGRIPLEFVESVLSKIELTKTTLEKLHNLLSNQFQQEKPHFPNITKIFNDIEQIYKFIKRDNYSAKNAPTQEQSVKSNQTQKSDYEEVNYESENQQDSGDTLVVSGRKEAYQALKDIALFLKTVDPYSPVPDLVLWMSSWKDKTLLEILSDLENDDSKECKLLRLLTKAAVPEYKEKPVENKKSVS